MSVSTFLDMTAMNGALKELYAGQVVQTMVYTDNPGIALVKKNPNVGGKYYPVPIIIGTSQGRSSVFLTAQGNQTAANIQEFLVTRAKDYSIASIDGETLEASRTDKMAFLTGSKTYIDNAIRACTNSLASAFFRTGTGTIGQISTISTGVITLVNTGDIVQFEINQALQSNATDGGTPRTAIGYVISVNRTAGTFVVSATLGGAAGTPTSWAASDFLLTQGDNNAKIKGLAAWLPFTAPTSGDSFFGIDRSVDPVRLAGVRYDGSNQSIEEAMIDASSLTAREGGKVKTGMTNFQSWSALEKGLGSKVQYVDFKGPAEIGFRGIVINGANSQINIFPDRSCQPFTAFLLQMDTWELISVGDAPKINMLDGNEMLRVYNADAAEVRVSYYAQLKCNAPGWNANVKLGA